MSTTHFSDHALAAMEIAKDRGDEVLANVILDSNRSGMDLLTNPTNPEFLAQSHRSELGPGST